MATFTLDVEEEIDEETGEALLVAMEDILNSKGYTIDNTEFSEF